MPLVESIALVCLKSCAMTRKATSMMFYGTFGAATPMDTSSEFSEAKNSCDQKLS
jgi:hypothetical protein